MKKILIVALVALFVTGCQTLEDVGSSELVVQYSTMKLIEQSDDIEAEDVLGAVEQARSVVENSNEEFTYNTIRSRIADKIGFENLDPSDQILIRAIADEVQSNFENNYESDLISDEVKISLSEFLDQVETAAELSQ